MRLVQSFSTWLCEDIAVWWITVYDAQEPAATWFEMYASSPFNIIVRRRSWNHQLQLHTACHDIQCHNMWYSTDECASHENPIGLFLGWSLGWPGHCPVKPQWNTSLPVTHTEQYHTPALPFFTSFDYYQIDHAVQVLSVSITEAAKKFHCLHDFIFLLWGLIWYAICRKLLGVPTVMDT